jgi:predicted PurR-regulated permease PerM
MLGLAAVWEAVTAVCLVIITLCILATAGAIVYVVLRIKSLFAKVAGQVKPLADRGQTILASVERTADSAGEHIQRIGQRSEETVGVVADRVQAISAIISDLISHPLISAAALAAAVRRAVETLSSKPDQATSQH